MQFIGRICLREANVGSRLNELPDEGSLLFFYDTHSLPGGWDPKDANCFAVLSVPDLPSPLSPESVASMEPRARGVSVSPLLTYPSSWEHPAVEALGLSDEELDEYESFIDGIYGDTPRHQLCGNPSTIQGEGMALLCQLASSGHYCGGDWSHLSDVMPRMEEEAKRWRLLLQVDTDDELGFVWGDAGMVYFWAPEDLHGRLQIGAAWVAMQCC